MTTTIPSITALPAVPNPNTPATFETLGYPFTLAQANMAVELEATRVAMNTVGGEVTTLANTATTQATAAAAANVAAAVNAAAAAASAGATVWVTGTTYAAGVVRYSPTNFQTYRDTAGGLSSTDPASDTTGRWISAMLPQAELPNLPPTAVFNFASGVIDRRFVESRSTARTRVGKFGVGQAVAAGVAVADYDVVTRECRGYLAEPAATYVAINSEDFSGWGSSGDSGGGFGASVAAPDGTLTAKIWTHPNSTGSFAYGATTMSSVDASGQAVFEIWVRRPAGSGSLGLIISDVYVVSNSAVRAVDETWRKLTFTSTTLVNTANIGIGFSGNVGEVFEFWHPQLTLGTVAGRSYEPTESSNVTTVAGGLTLDLTAHDEIINPRGFTFVVVFDGSTVSSAASERMIINLAGGGGNEQVRIVITLLGVVYAEAVTGGSVVASLNLGALSSGRNVVAFSVAENNFSAVARGGELAADTSGGMPAVTLLGVGRYPPATSYEPNTAISLLATFPRACTANELRAFVNNF